jgi:hypothetical protein
MISHSREVLVLVEKGIIRYTFPIFFDFEKHLGREIRLQYPLAAEATRVRPLPLEQLLPSSFDIRTFKERRNCCG